MAIGENGDTASSEPNSGPVVDATGLACPLPILRAQRALRGLAAGATLTVLASDPAALSDFPAYCRQTGHRLLEQSASEAGVLRFVLCKRD